MTDERDMRDLVGDEVAPEELERLARVDAVLRTAPAPPADVPGSLTRAVARIPEERRTMRLPGRLALAAALVAALAALAFGAGRWSASPGEPEPRFAVRMQATDSAPRAAAVIEVGDRDPASGNWTLELDVSGLPQLPADRYYVLWLEKDGKYAATCGTFNVGPGRTRVEMTASYRLPEYDAWVVSEHGDEVPPLLRAPIGTPRA